MAEESRTRSRSPHATAEQGKGRCTARPSVQPEEVLHRNPAHQGRAPLCATDVISLIERLGDGPVGEQEAFFSALPNALRRLDAGITRAHEVRFDEECEGMPCVDEHRRATKTCTELRKRAMCVDAARAMLCHGPEKASRCAKYFHAFRSIELQRHYALDCTQTDFRFEAMLFTSDRKEICCSFALYEESDGLERLPGEGWSVRLDIDGRKVSCGSGCGQDIASAKPFCETAADLLREKLGIQNDCSVADIQGFLEQLIHSAGVPCELDGSWLDLVRDS
uniref:Uncharacterized protein n=1 Tax=Pyrodinium bahamense TaxID=73915 RepID=A0A7S0AJK5_9DINO